MPFESGLVVLCQQGNVSREGHTHSGFNNLHALDWSNDTLDEVSVVSAASGRVAFVFGDSTEGDFDAGAGYGNQVKIDHGYGFWTYYAHLDRVLVNVRDVVHQGQKIGTLGATGAAGNRHLHFSLHRDATKGVGAPATIPIQGIVTADMTVSGKFGLCRGRDFNADADNIWDGHLYASENDGASRVAIGMPEGSLAQNVKASHERLFQEVSARSALAQIGHAWATVGPDLARQRLEAVLKRAPGHEVADLWWAAMVSIPEGNFTEARLHLNRVLSMSHHHRRWESWLAPWAHYFLGTVAKSQSRFTEAKTHFATSIHTSEELRLRHLAQHELNALVREAL